MNNRYLKKVELPDTLTSIEAEAFYECEALTDIDVYNTEDGMVIDSEYAVDLPDGLTELGAAAFADCQMIESVRIPEQITKLNGNTFFACFSLKEVVLPENLSEIGNKEFYYCRKLENVYFYGDVPEKWGEDVFVIDRFGNIPEELTLHYNLATTEKWTEGEWIGPDGVTYRTEASIVIENPDEPDKKPSILGDIDGDEKITTSDASAILRYIVGYVDDSVNIQYGDVDGDEKITTSDASAILRYIVGYEDNPGIGQAIEK